jgi:hypothetical protein
MNNDSAPGFFGFSGLGVSRGCGLPGTTCGGFFGGLFGPSSLCAIAATDNPTTSANINIMCFTNFIFPGFLFAKYPHRGKRETCVAIKLGNDGAKDTEDSIMTQMQSD